MSTSSKASSSGTTKTSPISKISQSQGKTSGRVVVPNVNVPPDSKHYPNSNFAGNRISTSKYTYLTFLPKNLFEQFHRYANLYFLVVQILNWLPGMDVFIREVQLLPLLFVLSVTAIKDGFEDKRRHASDKKVNNLKCRGYDRKTKRFVQVAWQDVKVGDIVHLSCNEKVPADILLLKAQSVEDEGEGQEEDFGTCYVETSNLDGESNLKQRTAVRDFAKPGQQVENMDFNFVVECDKPNMKLHKFSGFIAYMDQKGECTKRIPINKDNLLMRGCVVKNTSFVEGLVIYAGHETKSMLNNKGPRHKRSRLEKMMNGDIIWCIVILLVMCTISSLGRRFWIVDQILGDQEDVPFLWLEQKSVYHFLEIMWSFFTFVILYQMIIPISLYVIIEMVKLGQVYYIHRDDEMYDKESQKRIECRALNITEDLGQVEYIFSDKTGTLTENKMEFRCCTIRGIDYTHQAKEGEIPFELNPQLFQKVQLIVEESSGSKRKHRPNLNVEQSSIRDFFILLAICNTAMPTKKGAHADCLNAKGQSVLDAKKNSSRVTKTSMSISPSTSAETDKIGKMNIGANLTSIFKRNRDEGNETAIIRSKTFYESESPDEVALVSAAHHYNMRLLKRKKDQVSVSLPDNSICTFQVLNILPFDSNRKRMSIIVRCPYTKRILLLCKGSDLTVLEKLSKDFETDADKKKELKMTETNLKKYSTKGYRVLCMGRRHLSEDEYQEWAAKMQAAELKGDQHVFKVICEMEDNLELLGATAIEDRLQYRVPEVISSLRAAGIVIWVLTGDKMETATNIAKSCSLFNADMNIIEISLETVKSKKSAYQELISKIDQIRRKIDGNASMSHIADTPKLSWLHRQFKTIYEILNWDNKLEFSSSDDRKNWGLVIDGPSLNFVLEKDNLNLFIELTMYCSSVLCCRVTPSQKSIVVKCVKRKLHALTLAIGDGANDVAMIQTAHVGVGISGLEGTQAVMASDFAISKFHFLERLLLVHGNLCYNRLALTILYFFYKNTIVIFIIFIFQFYCGFSGQSILDDMYLMLVNILFTTIPAGVRGIFEKDYDERVYLLYPSLYERGRNSQVYTNHSFWVNTADSIYQSLVIFFVTYFIFKSSVVDMTEFGLVLMFLIIQTNLMQIAMETKFWNAIYVISFALSILFFLLTALILDTCNNYFILSTLGGSAFKILTNTVHESKFWISLLLVPLICLIPRITLRVLQDMIKPQFKIRK